jgi:hypothetical protein
MTLHDHPDNQKTKPSVTASILKSQLTPVDETTSVTLTFPKIHATAHLTCSMTSKTMKPYCVTIQGEKVSEILSVEVRMWVQVLK